MSHKLGICITYRNRKEHIEKLIPHLTEHLNKQGIEHTFYVGHQIDDKLFNRGAMKNIAAHYAFEDGCDYVAWHDVDMLPYEEADYSYPDKKPVHIATKLSKYEYGLGYDDYFGGVVLFTKKQVEKTNGYSNGYWDWGQEDDDLLWRCHYEKLTDKRIFKKYKNKRYAYFDANKSYIALETTEELNKCLSGNHTISILFKAEQQPEKVPLWLVGDRKKKFIEYPLIRNIGSWTWGLSFNNSRTINMTVFDEENQYYNNWAKKYENQWTWVTMSFNDETKEMYLYVNDELITNQGGVKSNRPYTVGKNLRKHQMIDSILLGICTHSNTFYKGSIAEVKIFDRYIDDVTEAIDGHNGIKLHVDFFDGVMDNVDTNRFAEYNVKLVYDKIEVIDNSLPSRRESRFECMNHIDEGYVNGKWAKGETTAQNEKRFVMEMQQGEIDYKNDGINQILDVLEIDNVDEKSYINTKFINVRMK
jgi:hypothetical protein